MTLYPIIWKVEDEAKEASYKHKSDHRDGTPGKSQWTISEAAERQSFLDTMINNWIEQGWGWGIHTPGGVVAILGVDRDHSTEVFISRFDYNSGEWHGYPVNYKNVQQRPPGAVLRDWVAKTFLAKAQMRKIVKGQPCRT